MVLILCGLALLLGWLPRMHWGFWTDEAGTFWMACEGWRAAIGRTTQWAGQSVLYSMLESFFVAKGFWREPLLRIPSVVAALVAAWQLKRVAEIVFDGDRDLGWVAVVPFLAAPDILSFATSARPYALALAAALASFRYLLEWQQSGGRWTAVKYLAASVLVLHLQYLFGFVFVIQAAYLLACRVLGRGVRLWLPVTAAVALPLSMLPVLRSVLTTAHKTSDFAHAAPPSVLQLFQLCLPPALMLATGLGGLLLLVSGRNLKWRRTPLRPEFVFLIAAWTVAAPVVFFLVARFTSNSIFASRYLLFVVPAPVLAIVWLISGLERKEWRMLILLAILAGTVLHPGNLVQIFRDSPTSWREPLRLIAAETKGDPAPVFVESGVVQSVAANWREHDPATSPLFAALTAYPIRNRTVPLPYQFGEDVESFIRKTSLPQRFFLLAASDSPTAPWMSTYAEQQGFRVKSQDVGDFVVVQFQR